MTKIIDLVIPHVNCRDKVWRDNFLKTCMRYNPKLVSSMNGIRYNDDFNLVYYQLQLVNKNMPWINKIYLLLSNKEQIDQSLLPTNCVIVFHKDFIPFKYLPTFNSCTIEMFLWNIPNLSEYFIYANDDMLPIKPLKPSDFFYNGHIKMNYKNNVLSKNSTEYNKQSYNSYKIMGGNVENGYFENPEHTFTPMIKSHCISAFELGKKEILKNIRRFRNEYQHNQYIYPNYEKLVFGIYNSKIKFYYTHLDEPPQYLYCELINNEIICPNVIKDKQNGAILVEYLEKLCK